MRDIKNITKLGALALIVFLFPILLIAQELDLKKTSPLHEGSFIQNKKFKKFQKKGPIKALGLADSIEQALRKNYLEKNRKYSRDVLDLAWKDTWDEFYLPNISLSLDSGPYRVSRLKRGSETYIDRVSKRKEGAETSTERSPSGTLSLDLGEYTLFNWGKDYLSYLNKKSIYSKDKRNLEELRRNLKHEAIIKYFELLYYHKVEQARRLQLRHASFVYRFNREKITLRKVGKQEYYQSRAEYLKAQNDFYLSRSSKEIADEQMAYLISDNPGTRYLLKDELNYTTLKLTLSEAYKLAKNANPEILNAQIEVANAKRDHEITLKNNLPLPKVRLNLGAYTHQFNRDTSSTRYRTSRSSSAVDIVASVSATWSITGAGGLFNQRRTDKSMLAKAKAFNTLAQQKHAAKSNIQTHFYNIKHLEDQIKILEARNITLQKTFDIILNNYLNRKTSFLHFQDALIEMVDAEILKARYEYSHSREKILLAGKMGTGDYPGENFENMAKPRVRR